MSEQSAGARRTAAAVELMPMSGFQDELRRSAQFFRQRAPAADPLAETVKQIQQNPAYAQSRLMTRILVALAYQEGEFRRAEAATLDSESLFLVLKLMDAYAAGAHSRDEWVRAVDAARAAELGAGG